MRVLAIDPGTTKSAYVVYDSLDIARPVHAFDKDRDNEWMRAMIRDPIAFLGSNGTMLDALAIEMIASYGMAVGREVFETCVHIGRFAQCWRSGEDLSCWFMVRTEVKMHLCHSARAGDSNIRQALIDRFGGSKAIGRKKTQGPLFGIAGDCWAALALAVTFADQRTIQERMA